MAGIGVQLQYSFDGGAPQRGSDISNPLFELLQALRDGGSILKASRQLGQSYRHTWGSIKRWEEVLGQPLVVWAQGQRAQLTPFAERMMWAELRARARLAPHIEALRVELARVVQEALAGDHDSLTVLASHDLALPVLGELVRDSQRLHIDLRFVGSVDALQALAEGRCQVAGFHVPVLPSGEHRFAAEMRPRLKPGLHKLIAALRRTQGLIVAPGNPLQLRSLKDLPERRLRFINRQSGSGTRLLTEHLMAEAGVDPQLVAGWNDETENSHVAVAASVASGVADVGVGVSAAAQAFGLGFVPLVEEDYFLVCLKDVLEEPPVQRLRQALAGPAWAQALGALPGYHPAPQPGEVLSLTRALPWWTLTPRAAQADSAAAAAAPGKAGRGKPAADTASAGAGSAAQREPKSPRNQATRRASKPAGAGAGNEDGSGSATP
ncbi:MAG: helix-turn-helix transcriptional regulator [Rubrivivax sp.]|nr:helix-turn-helix transcriptional regulator [Rubrivivax sp.]